MAVENVEVIVFPAALAGDVAAAICRLVGRLAIWSVLRNAGVAAYHRGSRSYVGDRTDRKLLKL